jgi:hypothetical protein
VNNFRITKDALDDDGFALNLIGTAGADQGKVQKTAASNLRAYGVNSQSTKDPLDNTAKAEVEVAIVREGTARVKLSATNAAIIPGDTLIAIAGGFVNLYTPTTIAALGDVPTRLSEISRLVGYAEEAKAQNAGGKILTRLQLNSFTNGQNG